MMTGPTVIELFCPDWCVIADCTKNIMLSQFSNLNDDEDEDSMRDEGAAEKTQNTSTHDTILTYILDLASPLLNICFK